jgi:hypothetical protein
MPVQPTEEEQFTESLEASGGASGTTIKLTGDPDIDALLQQFSTSEAFDKTMAYVYGNLTVRPKLKVADKQRAIYATKGVKFYIEYSLSDLDIAWLARSLKGEGISNREMASIHSWILLNRFLLLKKPFGSFWRYILFFSQPINPRWRRTGEFCKVGGKYYNTLYKKGPNKGKKQYCSEKQLKRRDELAFDPIPTDGQAYAEEFAAGILEAPNRVYIDFGSTGKKGGITVGREVVFPLDNLLEPEFIVRWERALSGTQKTAQVILKGTRKVQPQDTIPPLKTNQLLAYIQEKLSREQDGLAKAGLSRGDFSIAAAIGAQASADSKGQQIANAVQTVTTLQNAKPPSPAKPVATSSNGQQVCSDDTWNFV